MSDFVKPKTKEVTFTLRKDLCEGEEICERCKGTGIIVSDNLYGLSDEPNRKAGIFPYKHQSLIPCPDCFNGVVKRCNMCGKIIPRWKLKCNCEGQREINRIKEEKREQRILDEAILAPKDNFEMFYSDYYSLDDGFFSDFDNFFENWFYQIHEGEVDDNKRPEFVYGTEKTNMKINAIDIVEDALSDFYDDAIYNIGSEKIKELQSYLDEWCKSCGVGDCYWVNRHYKVWIPWDKYEG